MKDFLISNPHPDWITAPPCEQCSVAPVPRDATMESISVFDIFKIGVGPSSSHTMGPWRAAQAFVNTLRDRGELAGTQRVVTDLFGSLAKTGHGHGTDVAVMLGLSGEDPVTIDPESIPGRIEAIKEAGHTRLGNERGVGFNVDRDIVFHMSESLPFHPNGIRFTATLASGEEVSETYYSVGGGFIVQEGEVSTGARAVKLPFPIDKAEDLARWCRGEPATTRSGGLNGTAIEKPGLSVLQASSPPAATGRSVTSSFIPPRTIPQIVMENEKAWRTEPEVRAGLLRIWRTMAECIYRGCHTEGVLPGGLNVTRRGATMNRKLIYGSGYSGRCEYDDVDGWLELVRHSTRDFQQILRWVSTFALAVNEENAAFGRVVTAPTNGAAGVIPAVLMYAWCFCTGRSGSPSRTDGYPGSPNRDSISDSESPRLGEPGYPGIGEQGIIDFMLTAGELGSLFKKGATISAAMGGCQAEIGVSSAMAAGGLAQVLGATPGQAMMAAEIAMEHHLGMTCDPIGGLVQIPCIERNTMGAIKAITAAHIALESDPTKARVSLDGVIKTMWETALDMQGKYKETSEGGLAVHISVGVSEC
jgi:L-serine dehydratase